MNVKLFKVAPIVLCTIFLMNCSSSVTVPPSKIPNSAWHPGDIGEVVSTIYIEDSEAGLRLRLDRKYNIVGTLKPGDKIKVIRCVNYPLSTTGGTHLEMEAISGKMSGFKFTNGIIFEYAVDTSGEAYPIPDSNIIRRL